MHCKKHSLCFLPLLVQVRSFVDAAYKRTVAIVEEKKQLVSAMSQELLSKEVSRLLFECREESV